MLFVVSLVWVYQPLHMKTKQMQEENKIKTQELQQLKKWEANKEEYESDTERLQQEKATYEEQFPKEVKEEDSILLVRSLEKEMEIEVSSMAFQKRNLVYTTTAQEKTKQEEQKTLAEQNEEITQEKIDEIEGIEREDEETEDSYEGSGLALYQNQSNIQFQTSYQGIKDMISYIKTLQKRTTVDSIQLDYNAAEGNLIGEATLDQFTLEGTQQEYQKPDAGNNQLGVDNLFGTFEKKIKKKQK